MIRCIQQCYSNLQKKISSIHWDLLFMKVDCLYVTHVQCVIDRVLNGNGNFKGKHASQTNPPGPGQYMHVYFFTNMYRMIGQTGIAIGQLQVQALDDIIKLCKQFDEIQKCGQKTGKDQVMRKQHKQGH